MKNFVGWVFLLFPALGAVAQIPRNADGQFEYAHHIQVESAKVVALPGKVREFFKQPFMVHWDTVSHTDQENGQRTTGRGFIEIRVKNWSAASAIPVTLQFDLITSNNGYQYVIHQFTGRKPGTAESFPLEEKPPGVKATAYDLLLNKTHRYVSTVISLMKRDLGGE